MNTQFNSLILSYIAGTVLKCGGRFLYSFVHNLSVSVKVNDLLTSVHICWSYCKNEKVAPFYRVQCSVINWDLHLWSYAGFCCTFIGGR